jgi:hypothetical protein
MLVAGSEASLKYLPTVVKDMSLQKITYLFTRKIVYGFAESAEELTAKGGKKIIRTK